MKKINRYLLSFLSLFFFSIFLVIIGLIILFSIGGHWEFVILVIFIFLVLQICFSFFIFFSKRIHEVKASWLLVISAVPIIGIFVLLIFGLTPFKLKNYKENLLEQEIIQEKEDYKYTIEYIKKNKCSDVESIYNFQKSPLYQKNDFKLIDQKEFYFESINLIRKATKFIYFNFYIVADSLFFKTIINELIKKSKQGIKIKFMYDYAGCKGRIPKKVIDGLKANNIEIAIFNPPGLTKYYSMINFRSHRKAIIVDNKYAITGGSNIADEYINIRKEFFNWRDINFILEGEIVNSLSLSFLWDWYNLSNLDKNELDFKDELNKLTIHKANKNIDMQLIQTEPYISYKFFKNYLLNAFSNAKQRIYILTPYIAINNEIIEILNLKSLANLDIKIILPRRPDNKKFIIDVNTMLYNKLNSNIEIYEYDGFIHSKGIIIDNDIILGTNNMDYRSIMINFETAISIKNKEVLNIMLNEFNTTLNDSIKIDHKEKFKKSKWYKKIKMKFINVIYPLV